MSYVKALAREPLAHCLDFRCRAAKARVEFRRCQPFTVVRRSRVLQLGQQLVERGVIAERERNMDCQRKARCGMRSETRRFCGMVPVKQRVALRRPDLRHERRRGRDKPSTEGNTSDAVPDSLHQAPVNVRFKHAHATPPLIRISIAGPASIRAACEYETHRTPNHGTRDHKEHLLDQPSAAYRRDCEEHPFQSPRPRPRLARGRKMGEAGVRFTSRKSRAGEGSATPQPADPLAVTTK